MAAVGGGGSKHHDALIKVLTIGDSGEWTIYVCLINHGRTRGHYLT